TATLLLYLCALSTLPQIHFPYTTLFRSHSQHAATERQQQRDRGLAELARCIEFNETRRRAIELLEFRLHLCGLAEAGHVELRQRSEEHTSELQSHLNLVCRLLLEKKYIIAYGDLTKTVIVLQDLRLTPLSPLLRCMQVDSESLARKQELLTAAVLDHP